MKAKFTIFLTILMMLFGWEMFGQTTVTLVSSSSSSNYEEGFITGVSGTNNATWTTTGFTMTQNKNNSTNNVALTYAEIRVYSNHSLVFEPNDGYQITSIVANASSNSYATPLGSTSTSNCTLSVSGSVVTITPTDGTQSITLVNGAQARLNTIVVTYTTTGGTPTCAIPTFSPEAGTYNEVQNVSISCTTEDASIYYTTDGTEPTTTSTLYTSPIEVANDMTIKAIAAKEGYNNSSIAEAEYVIEIIAPVTFSRIASHNLITTTDTYMIVDVNSGRALSSANGSNSAPAAVSVTISDNTITGVISDELKWKFEATADGYIIHPANNEDTWLYSTNANNGVRVGTNANSTWTLDIAHDTVPNYHGVKHNGTNRYIGVYNNQDWRGYTTIGLPP